MRTGPSPITARQPLTWTTTGGNGRALAAKANRNEPPPSWAGHVNALRGISGSPQSAVASPRTSPGSRTVLPRGKIEPTWKSRKPPVRLTTTLVRRGMSVHNAAAALVPLSLTAGPPGSAEATARLAAAGRFVDADWPVGAEAPADADWPAGTCPQAATTMIAPAPTVTNAPRPAAPSCCIRRTSPSPPTMGWNACARPPADSDLTQSARSSPLALDGSKPCAVPFLSADVAGDVAFIRSSDASEFATSWLSTGPRPSQCRIFASSDGPDHRD